MNAALEGMQLSDRIELRRFVGREFLLWLWFESELFEATLETRKTGAFGLWLEGRLVLDEGRESTTIKGTAPGQHREAKESLLRGKLPERAGLHLSWGDNACTLVLKGETLALAGVVLPTALDKAEPAEPLAPPQRPRMTRKKERASAEGDEEREAFYERMHLLKEVEGLLEALYGEFLVLRTGPAWNALVLPALTRWASGTLPDADRYARDKSAALGTRKR